MKITVQTNTTHLKDHYWKPENISVSTFSPLKAPIFLHFIICKVAYSIYGRRRKQFKNWQRVGHECAKKRANFRYGHRLPRAALAEAKTQLEKKEKGEK